MRDGKEEVEELELDVSEGLRDGVTGGADVVGGGWKEVLARIPAEISTPIAEVLDFMLVAAKLAILVSVFSPDILS